MITKDREEEVAAALKSILRQDYDSYEVIIVNNGPPSKLFSTLAVEKKVKVIQNEKNRGACVARNQAINIARGKYCWFFDDDAEILQPHCLSFLVATMENDHLKEIASLGGEYIQKSDGTYGQYSLLQKNGRTLVRQRKMNPGERFQFTGGYFATCNCFTRTEDVFAVGGFDPGYFFYGEDKDLGYRILQRRRYHLLAEESLILHKRVNKGFQRNPFISNYLVNRNRLRFCLRNYSLRNNVLLPVYDTLYLVQGRGRMKKILELPFIAAAYVWNGVHLAQTLKSKKITFLSDGGVNRFEEGGL